MKKITKVFMLTALMVSGLTVVSSCGKGSSAEGSDASTESSGASAVEEVRNYGKYFIEKVSANELDSLQSTYPDISQAEALVALNSDTVMVSEITPGQYDVTLAPGVSLKVNRTDNGTITVTESSGLFSFPKDKLDTAEKTGMIKADMSDAEKQKLLNDNEYFNWLKKKASAKSGYAVSVTPGKLNKKNYSGAEGWNASMTLTVKNSSDKSISGSDYSITYKCKEWDGGSEDPYLITSTLHAKGVDISPNGSAQINISRGDADKFYDFKVVPAKGREDALKNDATTGGNEYQEYLNSKK